MVYIASLSFWVFPACRKYQSLCELPLYLGEHLNLVWIYHSALRCIAVMRWSGSCPNNRNIIFPVPVTHWKYWTISVYIPRCPIPFASCVWLTYQYANIDYRSHHGHLRLISIRNKKSYKIIRCLITSFNDVGYGKNDRIDLQFDRQNYCKNAGQNSERSDNSYPALHGFEIVR